jgi:2,4-diaminopentanoate dehydrogenase
MIGAELRPLRAIVYGLGSINILATRYMIEKGVSVVGVADINPDLAGRDVGEVIGLGRRIGVTVCADAKAMLATQNADIAILSVCSRLDDLYPHIRSCVEAGLNVITPAEEALYPWSVAPDLARDLDVLARRYGVSITGAGAQDSFRVNMVALLSGACHRIDRISVQQTGFIARLGAASLRNYHLGEPLSDFARAYPEGRPGFFSLKICIDAVTADLGLSVCDVTETVDAIIADQELLVPAIPGGVVRRGTIAGLIKTARITTEQGIEFQAKQISTAVGGGDGAPTSISECRIEGHPGLQMSVEAMDHETHSAAAASMVNRIPDVVDAEPGFVTVNLLPKLKYRPNNFNINSASIDVSQAMEVRDVSRN